MGGSNEYSDGVKLLVKLIYLIDSKDSYTRQHSENVARYAFLLGEKLGLSRSELEIVYIGSLLHDVGKIGVPDYLLTKDSHLTNNEYEMIKRHVTIGEALVSINGYDKIKGMIRSHHERLDGKGYPDGLKGHNIPYFARILSVVDTFDAMTTKRAYNKIMTLEEAFEELLRVSKRSINCGTDDIIQQLDPYIVGSFIEMVKDNKDLMKEFKKSDLEIISDRSRYKHKK